MHILDLQNWSKKEVRIFLMVIIILCLPHEVHSSHGRFNALFNLSYPAGLDSTEGYREIVAEYHYSYKLHKDIGFEPVNGGPIYFFSAYGAALSGDVIYFLDKNHSNLKKVNLLTGTLSGGEKNTVTNPISVQDLGISKSIIYVVDGWKDVQIFDTSLVKLGTVITPKCRFNDPLIISSNDSSFSYYILDAEDGQGLMLSIDSLHIVNTKQATKNDIIYRKNYYEYLYSHLRGKLFKKISDRKRTILLTEYGNYPLDKVIQIDLSYEPYLDFDDEKVVYYEIKKQTMELTAIYYAPRRIRQLEKVK